MNNSSDTALPKVAIILAGAYVSTQMLADIGSLKIASIGGWAVDAGTCIYPLTFTLRDMIHKRLGKKAAQTSIVLAAFVNMLMALYFWFVSSLPPDAAWTVWDGRNVSADEAFRYVLAPAWYIVAASIAAELASEFIDTEIYQLWVTRVSKRFEWMRVLVSNAVSIPIDSLIFSQLAFAFGLGLPSAAVRSIFWFNVIVKIIVTLVSLPAIYVVKNMDSQ